MQTYTGEQIAAGDILLNNKGKYQGVIGIHGANLWLSEEAELIDEVNFGTRKNLLNENTIQFKKFKLFHLNGGENHD